MHEAEIIELVFALLVAVTLTVTISRRVGIPYPILLVLGGLLLALIPGLPPVSLPPDLVFLVFLPPILFAAGYFTSVRDFRANSLPIALLAFGLVLATTVVVGLVAQALIPGLPPAAAFALGAIVSPPDAIAITAIAQRLGLPRRLVIVLEGESLVNDATALVAYRVALVATVTGTFSLGDAAVQLVGAAAGGAICGAIVGGLTILLLGKLDDPPVEVTVSMLTPLAAYLPAEQLGFSGVLSVVTAAILVGYHSPRVMSSATRLLGSGAWQMLLFLLNGFAFILIGLQLPGVMEGLADRPIGQLLFVAVTIGLVVVVVRLVWVFPGAYLPRFLSASLRARDPYPPWRNILVLGWAGLRGMVSLAAALALPLTLADGSPFPERPLLIFITFVVILVTLVGQGLTLPLLIRFLGMNDDRSADHEEAHARAVAVQAAVERIDSLAREWPAHGELIDQLRAQYDHRLSHLSDPHAEEPSGEAETELLEHSIIRRAVIDAERNAMIAMRDRGAISDEVMRRVERDLDLEELRLEA